LSPSTPPTLLNRRPVNPGWVRISGASASGASKENREPFVNYCSPGVAQTRRNRLLGHHRRRHKDTHHQGNTFLAAQLSRERTTGGR
jgi:hypothetical protein